TTSHANRRSGANGAPLTPDAFIGTCKRDYVDGVELRHAESVRARLGSWFNQQSFAGAFHGVQTNTCQSSVVAAGSQFKIASMTLKPAMTARSSPEPSFRARTSA